MDSGLTFDKNMLATANYDGRFTRLYEVQGEKLRAIADFFNEPDARSVIRMSRQLHEANIQLEFLQHQVKNDWDAKYNALLESRNKVSDLLDELRIEAVKLLKANDDQVPLAQWEVALECVRHVIEKIEGGAQ